MAKALFFPNYLGGGFGHTGRCLALADAWKSQGGQAAFVISGAHAHRVAQAGYRCRSLHFPRVRRVAAQAAAFVYLNGMGYQIVRDGFDHPLKVEVTLMEAQNIIRRERPDVLVGDGWPLTHLLGRLTGIPVVQLVKSIANPHPARLAWWEDAPEGLVPPDPGPVFDPVRKRLGLPPLRCAEELLDGDLLLLPGMPLLDPLPDPAPHMAYVGPIIRRVNPETPAWLEDLDTTRPLVYISVGGAAGNAGSAAFYHLVEEAFEPTDFEVVVSTGGKTLPEGVSGARHIHWVTWAPTAAILRRSAAVVFHGGYTRMEVLEHAVPSVVIPFHTEQEYYGRLLEQAGVSRLLPFSQEPYSRFVAYWRGGKWRAVTPYSVHVRLRPTLRVEALRETVTGVMRDAALRARASELQAELNSYGGSDQAVHLIRNLLGS